MDRFFRAVDAVEADTFSVVVVQDFEGVAVEDGDDGAEKSAVQPPLLPPVLAR